MSKEKIYVFLKKSVADAIDLSDRTPLYAKNNPLFCSRSLLHGILSASGGGAEFLAPKPEFGYTDASGKKQSIEIVDKYYPKKLVQPFRNDSKIDPKLRRAATIAEERARAHSLSKCWHYVKEALVSAGAVKSRPQTTLAKQAGQELVKDYGFKKLPVTDPYQAPVGAVLVYGAKRRLVTSDRTEDGFVSDFRSKTPSRRPLLGIFAKS